MAKRFTDTELSDKEWFMSLSCRLKCVVRYLFDKCDNAGVWTPNYKLAAIYIGEPFTESEILQIDDGEQFQKLGEKILVTGFLDFQYGELSEKCNPHKPVIKKLIKYGLWENGFLKVPNRVPDTLKEEEKEKEKEMEMEIEEENTEIFKNETLVPAMSKMFLEKNEGYPEDQIKDFKSIRKIAVHFGKILGFKEQTIFTNKDEQYAIKLRWGELVSFVASDKHFSRYSLTQIEKYFQSIIQAKNGKLTKKHAQQVGQSMDFDKP